MTPELREEIADYLRFRHPNLTPEDLEISKTPGYWREKKPCPGGVDCRHAFRGGIGPCGGGMTLALYIAEHGKRDSRGRIVSPYDLWHRCKAVTDA